MFQASLTSKLRNEILQTNFNIVVWLINLLHTHHIIFALLELHFYLFDSTRVNYVENAAFDFFIFDKEPNKNYCKESNKHFNKPALLYRRLSKYIMLMRLKCEVDVEIQLGHLLRPKKTK